MKIVSVTACPTGIAHTYMAQESIEKEAKKRGYQVKVETQGGLGIENEISQTDVDTADVVLLAVAIGIDGEERFEQKEKEGKLIKVEPGEAIRKISEIFDQLEKL